MADFHRALRTGKYSARELVQAYLGRIETIHKNSPALSAVPALSSIALEEADKLDEHFKRMSYLIGPLHAVPTIIKNQVDTKGLNTTYASIIAKDNVPDEDAILIKKLKEAGAMLLGKNSLPDRACSRFSNSSIPPHKTKNPYDLDRDTSGSSAGIGAAVSVKLALIGLGQDTGGAIRVTSSFCGLV